MKPIPPPHYPPKVDKKAFFFLHPSLSTYYLLFQPKMYINLFRSLTGPMLLRIQKEDHLWKKISYEFIRSINNPLLLIQRQDLCSTSSSSTGWGSITVSFSAILWKSLYLGLENTNPGEEQSLRRKYWKCPSAAYSPCSASAILVHCMAWLKASQGWPGGEVEVTKKKVQMIFLPLMVLGN